MFRRMTIFVVVMVLVQGALAESPIPVETPGIPADSSVCVRFASPPTIDGDLSEWIDGGAVFKFMGTADDVLAGCEAGWDGPEDMTSIWSFMWDDDYLYFAAAIQDDVHAQPASVGSLRGDTTLFLP